MVFLQYWKWRWSRVIVKCLHHEYKTYWKPTSDLACPLAGKQKSRNFAKTLIFSYFAHDFCRILHNLILFLFSWTSVLRKNLKLNYCTENWIPFFGAPKLARWPPGSRYYEQNTILPKDRRCYQPRKSHDDRVPAFSSDTLISCPDILWTPNEGAPRPFRDSYQRSKHSMVRYIQTWFRLHMPRREFTFVLVLLN